jgi:hypothetical protein
MPTADLAPIGSQQASQHPRTGEGELQMQSARCERAAVLSKDALALIEARRLTEENGKTLVMMARLTRELLERARVRGTKRNVRSRTVIDAATRDTPLPNLPHKGGGEQSVLVAKKAVERVVTERAFSVATERIQDVKQQPLEPETEQERCINAVAARFYARQEA